MNYLEELRWLIEDRWQPDRGSRVPVPQPEVLISRETQEQTLTVHDFVVIEDNGGDIERTLTDQTHKTFRTSIIARTASRRESGTYIDGEDRLYGTFDPETREQERYGGMTGEIEKILDDEIDGGPNFYVVIPDSGWQRMESEFGIWAARLDVELRALV